MLSFLILITGGFYRGFLGRFVHKLKEDVQTEFTNNVPVEWIVTANGTAVPAERKYEKVYLKMKEVETPASFLVKEEPFYFTTRNIFNIYKDITGHNFYAATRGQGRMLFTEDFYYDDGVVPAYFSRYGKMRTVCECSHGCSDGDQQDRSLSIIFHMLDFVYENKELPMCRYHRNSIAL
jgi:hypothetical protein